MSRQHVLTQDTHYAFPSASTYVWSRASWQRPVQGSTNQGVDLILKAPLKGALEEPCVALEAMAQGSGKDCQRLIRGFVRVRRLCRLSIRAAWGFSFLNQNRIPGHRQRGQGLQDSEVRLKIRT